MTVFSLLRAATREATQATIEAVEDAGRLGAAALSSPAFTAPAVRNADRFVAGGENVGLALNALSTGEGVAARAFGTTRNFGNDLFDSLAVSLARTDGLPDDVQSFLDLLPNDPTGAAEAHLNAAIIDAYAARSGLPRESAALALAFRATESQTPLTDVATRQVIGFADAAGAEGADLQREIAARLRISDPELATQLASRWDVQLPPTPPPPQLSDTLLADPRIAQAQQTLEGLAETNPVETRALTTRMIEAGDTGRLDIARALADRINTPGADLAGLTTRADAVLDSVAAESTGGARSFVRTSLTEDERARRLTQLFDPSQSFDETVAGFPPAPGTVELPSVPRAESEALLANEPAEVRAARRQAMDLRYRRPPLLPFMDPMRNWAIEGDKFVRDVTRTASLENGLSFADFATAQQMPWHREHAARTRFELDLTRSGSVQSFEPPPPEGVPPFEMQAVLARPFEPERPTLVYLTEATSPPFGPDGTPLGTAAEILDGLREDVNVVLIRSPYQADFPNGPRFTAGYDNIQASIASTTQFMDDVVRQVRDQAPDQPIIMGGYSLGGANVNNYRGWFDTGEPGSGADFYIPMAAPESGYGGLFDPATTGATLPDGEPVPTWWAAAQLHPDALPHAPAIAANLSPDRSALDATRDEVFALIPRWDDAIQGIDQWYENYPVRYLQNEPTTSAGHLTGASPVTVPYIPGTQTPWPGGWPARGSIEQTGRNFRDVFDQYLETRDPAQISRDATRALDD